MAIGIDLTLNNDWGYSENVSTQFDTRIDLLFKSAKALTLCAFFSSVFCYGGLNGGASARRSLDGKVNPVQSATPLIDLNSGSSQSFQEDIPMSKDTQFTPASNVIPFCYRQDIHEEYLELIAKDLPALTPQDQADIAYFTYLKFQKRANRLNNTNIMYLPFNGGISHE